MALRAITSLAALRIAWSSPAPANLAWSRGFRRCHIRPSSASSSFIRFPSTTSDASSVRTANSPGLVESVLGIFEIGSTLGDFRLRVELRDQLGVAQLRRGHRLGMFGPEVFEHALGSLALEFDLTQLGREPLIGKAGGVTTGLASPSFPYFAVEPLVFLRHVEVPEGIPLAIEVGGS